MKLILLSKGQFSKVDDDDFIKFGHIKWTATFCKHIKSYYAYRNSPRFKSLHREIMGNPKGLVVDHIDHDTLNNQKENLRVCTHAENVSNRKGAQKNSTSGFRGVTWEKYTSRWKAQIKHLGKSISVGRFKDKNDAAKAYAEANKKYFGEFGGTT